MILSSKHTQIAGSIPSNTDFPFLNQSALKNFQTAIIFSIILRIPQITVTFALRELMAAEYQTVYITEAGTQGLCSEGTRFRRAVSCKNILSGMRKRVSCKGGGQNNGDVASNEGEDGEELGYRKAHCLSPYYSVFVARLAIMVIWTNICIFYFVGYTYLLVWV